jgi:hypothetical protein
MKRRTCHVVLLAAAAWLVSCASPPPRASFPDIGFSHLTPLVLDVAKIEVRSRYRSSLSPPNVEHRAPQSPEKVMRAWARGRLRAGGAAGVARLIIDDAAIVSEELPPSKGLKGFFTIDQELRFSLSMKARLEIVTAGGLGQGYAKADVSRSTTLPEDANLNDYETTLFQLVERAGEDFDEEMSRSIETHLRQFLK